MPSLIERWISPAAACVCIYLAGCAAEMKRGSERTLYSILDVLEVYREDIGKDIQITLNQKLLFKFTDDPERAGSWELVDYDRRTLLLLSETPRVGPESWGLLLQARAMGMGEVNLRFTPDEEGAAPRMIRFNIAIRR